MKRLRVLLACTLAFGAWAGSASADQGNAVVQSKEVGQGLVVLGTTTYRVTDNTLLSDANDNALALAELPTVAQGASSDDAAVWFESGPSDVQPPILHVLKLTGSKPR